MKKTLLAGVLAAGLLAVAQQHAAAWFNLYAGGAASISWGPPHFSYFANMDPNAKGSWFSKGSPPVIDPGFSSSGGYPSDGAGFPGYGMSTVPSFGTPSPAPVQPWSAPMPSVPSAPKGSDTPAPKDEVGSNPSGYQPVGYYGGSAPANFWDSYQGGYPPINSYEYPDYGSFFPAPLWFGR
jgi:hypothetical protein